MPLTVIPYLFTVTKMHYALITKNKLNYYISPVKPSTSIDSFK